MPDLAVPVADALLANILALADPNSVHSTLSDVDAGILFSRLKALGRSANATVRADKQRAADARLAMDNAHLQLQNLLYEKRHLEREIEKCNRFASIYQDVPLHSLEEYKQLAQPEGITDEALQNDHQLMLSRLAFELAERQRLEEQRKALASEKESKMKEYRDLEKLVSEWFTQGTGIELAITDLRNMGNKVAKHLGVESSPSRPASPERSDTPLPSDQMEVDTQPPAIPTPTPQIPTGPRIRS